MAVYKWTVPAQTRFEGGREIRPLQTTEIWKCFSVFKRQLLCSLEICISNAISCWSLWFKDNVSLENLCLCYISFDHTQISKN
jgi:hypothetical protein